MPTVKGQIETRLTDALKPDALEVIDFSAEHAGHAGAPDGGESHFRVRIKSESLSQMNRINQHRAVQKPLSDLKPSPIHALQIEVL